MVRMVRQKKEFVCSSCGKAVLKWTGICPQCKAGGTMKEHVLIPVKVKARATLSQKGLIRRAKNSERENVRSIKNADGEDPLYKNITSSTGRVGHITGMQIDGITATHVIENKNRTLPAWLNTAWIQIVQRGRDFGKYPVLIMEPSNIAKEYILNSVKYRTPNMAIIPQDRYEGLIRLEKAMASVQEIANSGDSNVVKVRKIQEIV